jgi:ABC-type multidrug transport system ATPase subunit
VWDIIEEAKPGRAIVLTTHSMEEVRPPLRIE